MNRIPRLLPAALAAVTSVIVVAPHLDARQDDASDEVFEALGNALAAPGDFSGVVQIEWHDTAGELQVDRVAVRREDGVTTFAGDRNVVASDASRYVEDADMWKSIGGVEGATSLPSAAEEWELRDVGVAVVAGVRTREIEAVDRDTDLVRQRIYIAGTAPYVVKREILDERGDPYRVVEFVRVTGDGSGPDVVPGEPADQEPDPLDEPPGDAPDEIGDGFDLVDSYELDDDLVHLFYSDGLFGVSVFVDEGELDAGELPSGAATREIDGQEVRAFATATGDVLVWEDDDDRVVAWVSDASPDQMAGVAASFTTDDDPGFLGRAADVVLGPFSWH